MKSIFLAAEYLKKNNKKVDCCCIASSSDDPYCYYLTAHLTKLFQCEVYSYEPHHHLCHASLAFYNSGFEQSLVVVIDRNGSTIDGCLTEVESVFLADYPCEFVSIYKNYSMVKRGEALDSEYYRSISFPTERTITADSMLGIVKVYESATTLIGEKPLENGKTMGLAAYGRDKEFENFFYKDIPRDNLFSYGYFEKVNFPTVIYRDYNKFITDAVDRNNYQFYADYAYQVQKQTQVQASKLIEKWVDITGIKHVCVTGGYGLNVVANEYYVKNLPHVDFYFEPLADDSGNSIGAAMHRYREETKDKKINKMSHTFFHGFAEEFSISNGIPCTSTDIAEFLSQQKIVAVYNSTAEAGPRALGNRSILFDARNIDAKEIINRIKKREWYRPFAAMVLEDDFDLYFETHGVKSSPFMTVSFQCRENVDIPGVRHVDGSCRVQTVSKDLPHIYELLCEFKSITASSVLLNTSFNLAGEALVETADDALKTFYETEIDVLWFPEKNVYISKISR
jgi:carbamoyltransferase